jgi:hypothetical protein
MNVLSNNKTICTNSKQLNFILNQINVIIYSYQHTRSMKK